MAIMVVAPRARAAMIAAHATVPSLKEMKLVPDRIFGAFIMAHTAAERAEVVRARQVTADLDYVAFIWQCL